MFESLHTHLRKRLSDSDSAVERDIAELLEITPDDAAAQRLQRYHRKIDVARKLMRSYDSQIQRAMSEKTVSSEAYLGLALIFIACAQRENALDELSRANVLRWANSAFHCIDLSRVAPRPAKVDAALQELLRKGCAA
jgi:hypothetical protein